MINDHIRRAFLGISIIGLVYFHSCINPNTEESNSGQTNMESEQIVEDSIIHDDQSLEKKVPIDFCLKYAASGIWEFDIDENGKDILIRGGLVSTMTTSDVIIDTLNSQFRYNVEIIEINNGTATVRINNETRFTQRSGSYGAYSFKWTLIFSLTELSEVEYVNLIFLEGDHGGQPGIYTRNMLDEYVQILNCSTTNHDQLNS